MLALSGCASRQTIVVKPIAPTKAIFYFFEDDKEVYNVLANIGRNGVAKANEKREGDGKTPSGVYSVTALFGEDDATVEMSYIKADEKTICVDDSNSTHYNKIIDKTSVATDFAGFEEMKRNDGQYAFGAVIDYNADGSKGMGSCIFIHIEKEPNAPTAGCVSLGAADMKRLFFGANRLQGAKRPQIAIAYDDKEFSQLLSKLGLRQANNTP